MCSPQSFQPTPARMAEVRRGRRSSGVTRRDLLRAAGLSAAALAVAPGVLGRGPLGGLLSSTAMAQTLTEAGICIAPEALSIQLYTMRDVMASDFEGTVQALADIGYRRVEHAGTDAGGSTEGFRAAFDARGIGISSGHRNIPFPYDEADMQALLDECEALGVTRINDPLPSFLLPDLVLASGGAPVGTVTSVQYGQYADALNQAAAAGAARGITVGYHNHNPEFLMLPDSPGQTGYDVLMAETDPALVRFEMDVYWVTAGGVDPVELLQRYTGRYGQLHIKDMDEAGEITFPGTGIIDFAAIVQEAAGQGIAEYIIEQDNAGQEAVRSAELGHALLTAGCAPGTPAGTEVVRIAGPGRAETAAALSARVATAPAAVAYVVGGATFADALSAGPAAAVEGGPLLLVDRDAVPAATRAELERLGVARIVVVGGPASVSDAVVAELDGIAPATRLAGEDRYATAAAVADAVFTPEVPHLVVATGEDFPDALAGATAAAGGPLLLTRRDDLPVATRAAVERLAPTAITVLGGPSAVSDAVVAELDGIAPTTRVAGPSRYDTAAAAAGHTTGGGHEGHGGAGAAATGGTVVLATGEAFPDALAAGATGFPVLLVQPDALPEVTRDALVALAPETVLVLGGPQAVAETVLEEVRAALTAA